MDSKHIEIADLHSRNSTFQDEIRQSEIMDCYIKRYEAVDFYKCISQSCPKIYYVEKTHIFQSNSKFAEKKQ